MKIILVSNVKSLGKAGDIIDVSDGHARNFLLPKGLAIEASTNNLKDGERKKASHQMRIEKEKKDAGLLAQTLSGKTVVIKKKVGENEKIFGSVTNKDIQEAINKEGIEIDKKSIVIDEPIKALGEYSATIKLPAGERAQIIIVVAAE